jgi:hypothetical protein
MRSARSLPTIPGSADIVSRIFNLPFYKALASRWCTASGHAAGHGAGLCHRAGGEHPARLLKGPVIFFSLLPMIITPLIGSLILFWMINPRASSARRCKASSTTRACRCGLARADLDRR